MLKKLGLKLGLFSTTIDKLCYKTEPEEYGMKVMETWLQQNDDVAKKGLPTWIMLATALKGRVVNCHVQADQILADFREGRIR